MSSWRAWVALFVAAVFGFGLNASAYAESAAERAVEAAPVFRWFDAVSVVRGATP